MRRNPRPLRPVDRRKLAMDIIEREARATAMSSRIAVEGANPKNTASNLRIGGAFEKQRPAFPRK